MKHEQDILRRLFPNASASTIARNAHLRSVVEPTVHQSPVQHRALGKEERKGLNPGRRALRITSFRVRLIDERNLEDKYFTDALRYAGILYDDSPEACEIQVRQVKVSFPWLERTVIEISDIAKEPEFKRPTEATPDR